MRFPSELKTALLIGLMLVTGMIDPSGSGTAEAATHLVTTLADSGPGSLRQAMVDANATPGPDTIVFAAELMIPGTVVLASPLPEVTDPAGLAIRGDTGGVRMFISGDRTFRPFAIAAGASLSLEKLTIDRAKGHMGGAMINHGSIEMSDVELAGWADSTSTEGGIGGALFNTGVATITRSALSGTASETNTVACAGGYGGAIYNTGNLMISDSSVARSSARKGAGIYNTGLLELVNVTVAENFLMGCSRVPGGPGEGGAIYNAGDTRLTHTTLFNNALGTFPKPTGAGIFNAGTASMANSILADDSPGNECAGALTTQGANLMGSLLGCVILGPPPVVAAPLLAAPLRYNGRSVALAAPPYWGSPALDTADRALCTAPPVSGKDVYGSTRPDGAECDLGAYEGYSTVGVMSVNDVAQFEGDSGVTPFVFTVTLLGVPPSRGAVFIRANTYAISPNGGDYAPLVEDLVFLPGETAKPLTVYVNGDLLPEANESFGVELWTTAAGIVHDRNGGRGSILTDEVFLFNGGFETIEPPHLPGWQLANIGEGIARAEREGSCFGANNTTGITFNGNRALNIRSSTPGDPESWGTATYTMAFTFGRAISFRALSENDDAAPAPRPVHFEVRLLGADGSILATHVVETSVLTTSPGTSNDGCLVGDARDGVWSSHSVDTTAFQGLAGTIEFRQHTNVPGKGFFTLIDDVIKHGPATGPGPFSRDWRESVSTRARCPWPTETAPYWGRW